MKKPRVSPGLPFKSFWQGFSTFPCRDLVFLATMSHLSTSVSTEASLCLLRRCGLLFDGNLGRVQRKIHQQAFTRMTFVALILPEEGLVRLGLLARSGLSFSSARTAFSGLACAATCSFFTGRSRSLLVAATSSRRLAIGASATLVLSSFFLLLLLLGILVAGFS